MSYFAELDGNNVVVRVIVADTAPGTGTWIETAVGDVVFAGPSWGYDTDGTTIFPDGFASPWQPLTGDTHPVTGEPSQYDRGDVVWHIDRLWSCTRDGTTTQEPDQTESRWRNTGRTYTEWEASGRPYGPTGTRVSTEQGQVYRDWESLIDDNNTNPLAGGQTDWLEITPPPRPMNRQRNRRSD